MSRLPIRIRVTLAFTGVMAVVLAVAGLFVYLRLGDQLHDSIDSGLRSRAGDVSALVRGSEARLDRPGQRSLIERDESFAQVLTPAGTVVDSTPQLEGRAVLDAGELRRASLETVFLERDGLPGIDGTARLLATPVQAGGREVVVVVGSSLGDRDEALDGLAVLLLIGGPVALALASLAGYGAAAGALRPVEAMRRRAAAITAEEPDERLPVGPAHDEVSRLGTTLNEMLDRLESARERERRFVDDASHELRTPLALHKTELETALRYGRGEEELRAAIASAIAEVDRLARLAEDLLVVARSEKGRLALHLERVRVADLLETVRARFAARAAQDGRELVAEADGDLVVQGDRLRLEQALTSMVDNALRHGEGEVRLWADRRDGAVVVHVGDQGGGFPPDFVARAFERFATAGPGREGESRDGTSGGAGLGLAIVETIARAHRGRAEAANDPKGGADVWIELPA